MGLRITSQKTTQSADDFWREYEEKTGEKILTRCLGKYVSGWDEFGNLKELWGLIIFTSGGFRFHHFPQNSWIESLFRGTGQGAKMERTIFIPNETVINTRLVKESKLWKKIFSPYLPQIVVLYRDGEGNERQLVFEADPKSGDFDESKINLEK